MKQSLRICIVLLTAASTAALQGCAGYRHNQRPWDPPRGVALFDQIPAWDDAAARLCAGHLPPELRRPGMTTRC